MKLISNEAIRFGNRAAWAATVQLATLPLKIDDSVIWYSNGRVECADLKDDDIDKHNSHYAKECALFKHTIQFVK